MPASLGRGRRVHGLRAGVERGDRVLGGDRGARAERVPRRQQQRLGGEVQRGSRSIRVNPGGNLRERPFAILGEQGFDEIVEGCLGPRAGPSVEPEAEHGASGGGIAA